MYRVNNEVRRSRIAYMGSQMAVKVPTVERSPLKFSSSTVLAMKIALPVIEWSEAKVPLKINVPTSLQQVPDGNSTLPAKATPLFVNRAIPDSDGCEARYGICENAIRRVVGEHTVVRDDTTVLPASGSL